MVVLKILKILGVHRLPGDLKKSGVFFVILKLAGITFAFNFGNQRRIHLQKDLF